jgi:hypothetical protein
MLWQHLSLAAANWRRADSRGLALSRRLADVRTMDPTKCNAPTKRGTPCRCDWPCEWHSADKRPLLPEKFDLSEGRQAPEGDPQSAELPRAATPEFDAALEKRDLRSLFWLTLEGVLHGSMNEKLAAIVATLGRAIWALGEEDTDREEAMAEAVVIGTLLHGFPPRDEKQWEIARRHFDERTLAGLEDWKPLDGWFSTVGGRQWPKTEEALLEFEHRDPTE